MNSPSLDGKLEEELANLLAACDDAMASGEIPTSTEILKHKRQQQNDVEKDLECMNLLRMVMPKQKKSSSNPPATIWHEEPKPNPNPMDGPIPPRRIGRFQVLRELGRGGCGVVFLARDPMLDRDVAIKVPRTEVLAKPHLKARFMQEGRTAASLDHANIVQVFEAGMVDDVCYIASAYCPGLTLAKWLSQRSEPVPVHVAGTIIMHLADATEHAHSRGVIHRDLKPANILLGSADPADTEELHRSELEANSESAVDRREGAVDLGFVPKITDFGLAKTEAGESGHTISGTIMGTPSYMAPEQADGKTNTATKSSDVYSLGAILYELLTGRPPFRGETVLAELNRVIHEPPLPPTKLRPKIPEDLETICLKCLQKEPGARYATAGALADDLGRFLNHEPIDAKPLSLLGRFSAWRRRKPLVAKLSAAIAFITILGFCGIFWQWRRAEQNADFAHNQWRRAEVNSLLAQAERDTARIERNIAIEERKRAEEERKRAESNYKRGRDILDQLSKLGSEMIRQPRMDTAARAVLQKTALFYTGFLEEKSDDPIARYDAAMACSRAGRLYSLMENDIQSEEMLRKGSELLKALVHQFPDNRSYRKNLVGTMREHGRVLRKLERHDQAENVFLFAIASAEESIRKYPDDAAWNVQLANTLLNWATDSRTDPFDPKTEGAVLRAIELDQAAMLKRPGNAYFELEYSLGKEELGLLYFRRGQYDRAIEEGRQSIELRLKHKEAFTYIDADLYLARGHNQLSFYYRETRQFDAAIAECLKARALTAKLVSNYPDRGWFQIEHANTYRWHALALARKGLQQQAIAELKNGIAIFPNDALLHQELAWMLANAADRNSASLAMAKKAIEKSIELSPNSSSSVSVLGMIEYRLGEYRKAAATLTTAYNSDSIKSFQNWELPIQWFTLSLVHEKLGDRVKAKAAYDRAIAKKKIPTPRPFDEELVEREATTALRRAKILP